jgi:hypothetical protein
MQTDPSWLSSMVQNVVGNFVYYLLGLIVTVVFTILKKKHSSWLSPALYGLVGGVLVLVLIRSGAIYARWPTATPIILVAVVLIAAGLHFAAVLVERKSLASAPSDQLAIRNSELRLIKDEVQKTIGFYTDQLRIRDNEAGKNSGRIGELEQKLRIAQGGVDDSKWLHDIANEQRTAIEVYIDVDCWILKHRLIGEDPYIDFRVRLANRSVYKLSLSTLSGFMSFGDRFQSSPSLLENSVTALGQRFPEGFTMAQSLKQSEATRLLNMLGPLRLDDVDLRLLASPGDIPVKLQWRTTPPAKQKSFLPPIIRSWTSRSKK